MEHARAAVTWLCGLHWTIHDTSQLYGKPKWTKLHSKQSHYMHTQQPLMASQSGQNYIASNLHTQQPLCTDKLHAVYTKPMACTHKPLHAQKRLCTEKLHPTNQKHMDTLGYRVKSTTHSVLWLRTCVYRDNSFCTMASLWRQLILYYGFALV